LCIVRGHIGGFRIHKGQLSENLERYRREQRTFSRPIALADRWHAAAERLLRVLPERVSARLADRSTLVLFDHARQAWRRTPDLKP
jgi:hypothetical protein